MENTLTFNDLSFEKQTKLIEGLKKILKERFEEEAKEKKKSLKRLMWEDYILDYELDDGEEKERIFNTSFDFFLEDRAVEILEENVQLPLKIEL